MINEMLEKCQYTMILPDYEDKHGAENIDDVLCFPAVIKIEVRHKNVKALNTDIYLYSYMYGNTYTCVIYTADNNFIVRKLDLFILDTLADIYGVEYSVNDNFRPTLIKEVVEAVKKPPAKKTTAKKTTTKAAKTKEKPKVEKPKEGKPKEEQPKEEVPKNGKEDKPKENTPKKAKEEEKKEKLAKARAALNKKSS